MPQAARSAFLASLPSSRAHSPVTGIRRAADTAAPAPAWASDLVAGGMHGRNYVALARARARAIAARVRDLQGIFADYRLELFGGIDPVSSSFGGVSSSGPGNHNTLFSALAHSVMEMTQEVENLSWPRSGERSSRTYTQAAKDMEEQFSSLVELLAKQATKLTDDLDAIVLLAQARVTRAETAAKDQVRQLLLAQAASRRQIKAKGRFFASWRRGSHRHQTRHEWRRQTVRKALVRLSRLAMLSAWTEWTRSVDSSHTQREREQSRDALSAAVAALTSQRELCVNKCRADARRQLLAACISAWLTRAAKAIRHKSLLFRALARHHGARAETAFDEWRAHAAELQRRELTRLRTLSRLGTLLQSRAWQHWCGAVYMGLRQRQVATFEVVVAKSQVQLHTHRRMAVEHSFTRHTKQKMLPAAFGHWHTRASEQRTWHMTEVRLRKILCSVRVIWVWQHWWGFVEQGRLQLLRADHSAALEDERAQSEITLAETTAAAAERMRRQWDACVNVWGSKLLRRKLSDCYGAWAASAACSQGLELIRLRVTTRRGILYQTRAWQQWLAVVDDSRAHRERMAYGAAVQQVNDTLCSQRDSSARQFVLAAQKWGLASCLACWVERTLATRRNKLLHFRSLSRKHRIWTGAVLYDWRIQAACSRRLERLLLKTVFKLGHMYKARVLERWTGTVADRKSQAERSRHSAAIAAAAESLAMYKARTVDQLLIPRAITRCLSACVLHWSEWSLRRISMATSVVKSLERAQLRHYVRTFDMWCERLDRKKTARLTHLFVLSRIGRLMMLRAWQKWIASTENTRLEQERADYAAALHDVDTALSRQWESWVVQVLRRRSHNQLRACFADWMGWAARRVQRTATVWRVQLKIDAAKLAATLTQWRRCVIGLHQARKQEELGSLQLQLSEQKSIKAKMDLQQKALQEEIASVRQAYSEVARASDAIVRREKSAAAAQVRAEAERTALEEAVEKIRGELVCSRNEQDRSEKQLDIARRRQVEERDQWQSMRTDVQKLREINERQEAALLAVHEAKQVEAAQRQMAERGRTEAVSALARLTSLVEPATTQFRTNQPPLPKEPPAEIMRSSPPKSAPLRHSPPMLADSQDGQVDGSALYASRPGGGLDGALREPPAGYQHVLEQKYVSVHYTPDAGLHLGFDEVKAPQLCTEGSADDSIQQWREDERLVQELNSRARADERAREEAEQAAQRNQARLEAVRLMLAQPEGEDMGGLD